MESDKTSKRIKLKKLIFQINKLKFIKSSMSLDNLKKYYVFPTVFLPKDVELNHWEPKLSKTKRKKLLDKDDYKERSIKYCNCLADRQTVDKSGVEYNEIVNDALSGKIYFGTEIEQGSEFNNEFYKTQLLAINRCVLDILKIRDEYKIHNKEFL